MSQNSIFTNIVSWCVRNVWRQNVYPPSPPPVIQTNSNLCKNIKGKDAGTLWQSWNKSIIYIDCIATSVHQICQCNFITDHFISRNKEMEMFNYYVPWIQSRADVSIRRLVRCCVGPLPHQGAPLSTESKTLSCKQDAIFVYCGFD